MRKRELTKKQGLIVVVIAWLLIIITGIATGLKFIIIIGVALILYAIYRAVRRA